MATFIVRRVLQGTLILFLATFLSYSIIISMPGGPVEQIDEIKRRGIIVSEGYLEQLMKHYGLDKPYPLSYFVWLFDPEDTFDYKWD